MKAYSLFLVLMLSSSAMAGNDGSVILPDEKTLNRIGFPSIVNNLLEFANVSLDQEDGASKKGSTLIPVPSSEQKSSESKPQPHYMTVLIEKTKEQEVASAKEPNANQKALKEAEQNLAKLYGDWMPPLTAAAMAAS